MADYMIVFRSVPGDNWQLCGISRDKTANTNGQQQALRESYRGPGTYAALRVDNAQTVTVREEPVIEVDETPAFTPPPKVEEAPTVEDPAEDPPADP